MTSTMRHWRADLPVTVFLTALFVLAIGSCATSSQTVADDVGGTVVPVAVVPADDSAAEAEAPEPTTAEAEVEAGGPADPEPAAELDLDSLVAAIRAEAAEPRTRSILPFGISWTPTAPIEGSAIAFRVLQPRGGLVPEAVAGLFAGKVVRFGRMHGTWLGIAAVPIDTYGPLELELEFRFGDGSVYEQTVHLDAAARQWDETSLSVAPKYSSPPPEVQDRIARDRREIRAVLNHASPEWLIDGPFEAPRPYDVTAEYGQKRVFNGEMQSRHTGLDLRGQVGAPVLAAGRGRVALAGDFYFSGNGIFLDHGLGVHTGYFHLSEILVSEGDMVEKGDLIGRAGATGRVTGPHLHWSLWVDGTGQDAGSLLDMDIPIE
jgi:murein DD-endopeptidase MepM/ murein hydrolase activator NlpD